MVKVLCNEKKNIDEQKFHAKQDVLQFKICNYDRGVKLPTMMLFSALNLNRVKQNTKSRFLYERAKDNYLVIVTGIN